MTDCIYCIDNDILQKLATFKLFNETIKLFGVEATEIRVLATAKYKFQRDFVKQEKGRLRRSDAQIVNYERTIELAKALPRITQSEVDSDLFEQLIGLEGIDVGEAILTTYVAQVLKKDSAEEAFILTGDKRYLKVLAKVDLPEFQELFRHRFWCLEQLVLRDMREYGFEYVRDRVVPVRDCDKACKVVFGSGALSEEENSLPAISTYIETLRTETCELLHPYAGESLGDRTINRR